MPRVGRNLAAMAQPPPSARSPTCVPLKSVPGVGCGRSRPPSQGEQQGHAELEGGNLVRLSLRAIDQHLSDVQRGERIWVPPCVRRDSSAADALQPYDSACGLNTTETNIAPRTCPSTTCNGSAGPRRRLHRPSQGNPEGTAMRRNGKGALRNTTRRRSSRLSPASASQQSPRKPSS